MPRIYKAGRVGVSSSVPRSSLSPDRVEPIQILTAERDGEDGLLVTFSDGTTTGYVAEELLELRPFREATED
jgi:hypothetical protein